LIVQPNDMARSQKNRRPVIRVPSPKDEQPRFGRVGLIAVVGFVVGVAWPSVAKLKLVALPPNAESKAEPSTPNPSTTLAAPAQTGSAAPSSGASAPARAPSGEEEGIRVAEVQILSCVDADGKRSRRCDTPVFGESFRKALRGVLACEGASSLSGRLSIGFDVDFEQGKLSDFVSGRSTTLEPERAANLVSCAEKLLTDVAFAEQQHSYSRYRVFYLVDFGARATASRLEEVKAPAASSSETSNPNQLVGTTGRATVVWETAIVRDHPKTGSIIARILGGTRLAVTARQGDWYRVKYDAKGSEGWVYREAIGL
jgi:hypothetical protein